MDFEFYLALFASVKLIVDAVKSAFDPLIERFPPLDKYRTYGVWAVLVIAGQLAAFGLGADADILANAGITGASEIVGIGVTGLVIVFGANVAHNLFTVLRSLVEFVKSLPPN